MARVTIEYENHVARVSLTRPDKMNAMDPEMRDAIIAAGEEVAASDARAVLLQGEGRAFCAGIDIMGFSSSLQGNTEDLLMPRTHHDANAFQEVSLVWRRVPVPVIAALHGVVYGAGMQIAMGADIRIAAPDLQMAIMEMKWGLVPDMGAMALWPQLIRSDVLRQMTYTAAPIGADQAERWGLVTSLADDPQAAALALAQEIASKSPSAMRACKALIEVAETQGREAVLLEESRKQVEMIGSADQMETVMAQMQKRPAVYK